ncbi:MAG: CoB--CoM heterodisulfide reductase iron-sulfur subunit A family protein [Desulfobacteraceae bacterium]|nr:MAG: CoB--CoM heterodisulfide reductase iron-sulfur subunit A family protein [Desulfobacteraceae bacterium]
MGSRMPDKNVLIIGGGVAGLTAAIELAKLDCHVVLIEKEKSLGGHAGQFTCKATDECAKCGACIVEEKIDMALSHANITIYNQARLAAISRKDRFAVTFFTEKDAEQSYDADAVIVATGFQAFDPVDKPFGYKRFEDVITNLDLEKKLRHEIEVKRPSDGITPEKIAFIQCVGSRDSSVNHLWCSRVCCGSALRMANLINTRNKNTEISFFYIDVQTFGKDFQFYYDRIRDRIRMIRAIPGDVFRTPDGQLKLEYYLPSEGKQIEELFDMIVLSVGIIPVGTADGMMEKFGLEQPKTGFPDEEFMRPVAGLFAAGTSKGPKTITEAVADAGRVALDVVHYLQKQ